VVAVVGVLAVQVEIQSDVRVEISQPKLGVAAVEWPTTSLAHWQHMQQGGVVEQAKEPTAVKVQVEMYCWDPTLLP
jgi:hypothetical protein